MNYKLVTALSMLLFSTQLFSLFDSSPWIVIDNTTKLDFKCKIQGLYAKQEEQEEIIVYFNVNEAFHITFEDVLTQDNIQYFKVTVECTCNAEKCMVINPIFFDQNNKFCNPQLLSVTFYHPTLQIAFTDFKHPENRYFVLRYDEGTGITLKTEPLSLYIKCLNNFKQAIRNIILAAFNAIDWLPY